MHAASNCWRGHPACSFSHRIECHQQILKTNPSCLQHLTSKKGSWYGCPLERLERSCWTLLQVHYIAAIHVVAVKSEKLLLTWLHVMPNTWAFERATCREVPCISYMQRPKPPVSLGLWRRSNINGRFPRRDPGQALLWSAWHLNAFHQYNVEMKE